MVAGAVAYDGLSADDLARVLGTPALECFDDVTSTLDVLHDLAADGAPAGTLVLADRQTRGRGRQGRPWHSPPGTGIWLGYLVRAASPVETAVLSLRVGLAVARTIGEVGLSVGLKWPNDLVMADRKLAGILCEARWSNGAGWVAVGIGMNVHGPLPEELRPVAVALDEFQAGVTRVAVLEALAPRLRLLSVTPTLEEGELAEYAGRDWLHGRQLAAPVPGTAAGIDATGALVVETDRGHRAVTGGSVILASRTDGDDRDWR
ncbi:MAG TPA: biotin--[acetyl-CoA-carboxylase] ligase [Gemmatimonadales bacterium]